GPRAPGSPSSGVSPLPSRIPRGEGRCRARACARDLQKRCGAPSLVAAVDVAADHRPEAEPLVDWPAHLARLEDRDVAALRRAVGDDACRHRRPIAAPPGRLERGDVVDPDGRAAPDAESGRHGAPVRVADIDGATTPVPELLADPRTDDRLGDLEGLG